jgi:hypothetical protein
LSSPVTSRLVDALAARSIDPAEAEPPFSWTTAGSRVAGVTRSLQPIVRRVVDALAACGDALGARPVLVAATALAVAPLAQIAGVAGAGVAFAAAAGVGLLCAAARSLHEGKDRRVVLFAVVAGALLRAAFGVAIAAQGGFPDETGTYHPISAAAAQAWRVGGASTLSTHPIVAGRSVYFHLLAGTYVTLGTSLVAGRVLGGFLGLAAALAAGEVGRALGGARAAAFAVAALALHPEHAFWSVTLSRDTLSTLLVLVALAIVLRRPGRLLRGNLLLAAAPLALLAANAFVVAGALAATLVLLALAEAVASRRVVAAAAALALAVAALLVVAHRWGGWFAPQHLSLARLHGIGTRADFLPDFEFTSVGDVFAYLPLGVAFVLLAPWPWAAVHAGRAVYGLLAATGVAVTALGVVGLVAACRRRAGGAAPVALFVGISLLLLAVLEGTSGILVRHRLPLTACLAVGAGALLAGLRPAANAP